MSTVVNAGFNKSNHSKALARTGTVTKPLYYQPLIRPRLVTAAVVGTGGGLVGGGRGGVVISFLRGLCVARGEETGRPDEWMDGGEGLGVGGSVGRMGDETGRDDETPLRSSDSPLDTSRGTFSGISFDCRCEDLMEPAASDTLFNSGILTAVTAFSACCGFILTSEETSDTFSPAANLACNVSGLVISPRRLRGVGKRVVTGSGRGEVTVGR